MLNRVLFLFVELNQYNHAVPSDCHPHEGITKSTQNAVDNLRLHESPENSRTTTPEVCTLRVIPTVFSPERQLDRRWGVSGVCNFSRRMNT